MAAIKTTYTEIGLPANWRTRETIDESTYQVTQGMASERIASKQNHIYGQYQRTDTDTKNFFTG